MILRLTNSQVLRMRGMSTKSPKSHSVILSESKYTAITCLNTSTSSVFAQVIRVRAVVAIVYARLSSWLRILCMTGVSYTSAIMSSNGRLLAINYLDKRFLYDEAIGLACVLLWSQTRLADCLHYKGVFWKMWYNGKSMYLPSFATSIASDVGDGARFQRLEDLQYYMKLEAQ